MHAGVIQRTAITTQQGRDMTGPENSSDRHRFILACGSAVGIGNLVGFPVGAAKNGGGAFLLMYAIFVLPFVYR